MVTRAVMMRILTSSNQYLTVFKNIYKVPHAALSKAPELVKWPKRTLCCELLNCQRPNVVHTWWTTALNLFCIPQARFLELIGMSS